MCFLAHAQGVVKMVWYGDVHIKQRAVIKFLVTKKGSVTNIHAIKTYTVSMLLTKERLVTGLHELQI